MPICAKCGSYFSEGSCPHCTPEDSPDSPVKTIEIEKAKEVRIIDPLELLDSIEKGEKELTVLSAEKELELKKLSGELASLEESEQKLKAEIDILKTQVTEMESQVKLNESMKNELKQNQQLFRQEIETLKSRKDELREKITYIKTKRNEEGEN